MKKFWLSLYDKAKAMVKGYVAGGGAAAAVTSILNAADTTELSSTEQLAYSLVVASVLGMVNMYRRPETHAPSIEHHNPNA